MADVPISFHVTCVQAEKPAEEQKKKLTVRDKSTLTTACLSLFGLPEQGKYIIQMYDKEFEDWLDVDDPMAVPDGGKLKITVCSGNSAKFVHNVEFGKVLKSYLNSLCIFCIEVFLSFYLHFQNIRLLYVICSVQLLTYLHTGFSAFLDFNAGLGGPKIWTLSEQV